MNCDNTEEQLIAFARERISRGSESPWLPLAMMARVSLKPDALRLPVPFKLQASQSNDTSRSTTPSPATAVGYDIQTYGPAVILGGNWQAFSFFGVDPADSGAMQHHKGVTLTVNRANNYGAQICTATFDPPSPSHFTGTAFGGGGYFEATMSFSYNMKTGNLAFWANDIESMAGSSAGDLTLRHWPGQANKYGNWIEVDIAEFRAGLGPQQMGIAIHNFYGYSGLPGVSTLGSGSPISVPPDTDFAEPHKYGFLWVPATKRTRGYAKWFFDRVQVGRTISWNHYDPALRPPPVDEGTGSSSAYSVLDTRHLALILGNGNTVKGVNPGLVTIYSVSVWQASTANNVSYQK